jgi:hypothetical protein|tara:strand:+ start:283 stop:537 length:255 start_codon:yes stop_codon:yes gene_type:complete
MKIFEEGEKVKWIQPMKCVPHPEGTLKDRNGNILPVFRDTEMTGVIVRSCHDNKYQVRPDGTTTPKDMESYYDKTIKVAELTSI